MIRATFTRTGLMLGSKAPAGSVASASLGPDGLTVSSMNSAAAREVETFLRSSRAYQTSQRAEDGTIEEGVGYSVAADSEDAFAGAVAAASSEIGFVGKIESPK